ncbi:unnamed protein product [Mesocestoides corti]|uniref:Sulfatase domain-containing protein n=1 Tax=Mesocestoides corti TaxID=53468 RepID=A0A0R3U3P0_MESCO|nr:unnamed protein product [Mesocestoides corti]
MLVESDNGGIGKGVNMQSRGLLDTQGPPSGYLRGLRGGRILQVTDTNPYPWLRHQQLITSSRDRGGHPATETALRPTTTAPNKMFPWWSDYVVEV